MKKNWITIAVLILIPVLTFAKGAIKGRVVDAETGEALPGANIMIIGTIQGAGADANGNFVVSNVLPGVYSVRASMIGYRTITKDKVEVMSDQTAEINFKLKETTIEMDPIVVLAGKSHQSLDQAPVSISVVTSRDIERRNAVNIIQALESAPGVMFIGNQINIRGSTGYTFGAGNKVLLLLDGVPVYASDTGEFNWDMLPPLDIEQIEVLKGAGSTLWGASALGGVVNVITKDPTPDGRLLFAVTSGKYDKPYYDRWDWTKNSRLHYMREDLSYSKRFGTFGMRLAAGRYRSTGYTQIGDFTKYNLTGKLDYLFYNGIKWTGYAAYSFIDRGFFVQWKGQNDPYEVDPRNLTNYAKTNQLNVYTKLAIPFSNRFAINLRASLVRTLMGNQFGSSANFDPAIGQGAEIQADWIPYPGHTVTGGLQYQIDGGSTKYFGSHKGYFIGPFLQDEWKPLNNLRFTAGFRYDRYQLVGGLKEDLFSPRIGVNWQPWSTTTFRASAGSGFRAATIVERFLELTVMNFKIKANPDLKAESSWAYDVGFRQYFTEDWNIDISLFDNEYWELIEAHMDLIRGQIQFRNIPRARIQGIEATTNFSTQIHLAGLKLKPGLQISVTAMNHKELEFNDPLPYRPKLIGTTKASLKSGKFMFEADYRYASKIQKVKIYPINDRVPMEFVDLRLSYEWGPLTAQIGVDNLLQYNYAPMESNLMPMRTFTAGVKGEF
jgi:outer membrane receptor for ferrienterochelin and colicins